MAITKATASSIAPAAKGSIVVGSATNDAGVLAVGTNTHILVADSTETLGMKWAAPAGGGKVLQVVTGTYSTETTVVSTTYTDSGLSLSITPTLATSKVLVLITQGFWSRQDTFFSGGGMKLLRGATVIQDLGGGNRYGTAWLYTGNSSAAEVAGIVGISFLDSPATTSATTYKTQIAAYQTSNNGRVRGQYDNNTSSITLLEIGA